MPKFCLGAEINQNCAKNGAGFYYIFQENTEFCIFCSFLAILVNICYFHGKFDAESGKSYKGGPYEIQIFAKWQKSFSLIFPGPNIL